MMERKGIYQKLLLKSATYRAFVVAIELGIAYGFGQAFAPELTPWLLGWVILINSLKLLGYFVFECWYWIWRKPILRRLRKWRLERKF